MYNHAPENYVCPLCQIVKGEVTSRGSQEGFVIYRDEHLTAFIAGKWWLNHPGHVIVVPNNHFENIYTIPKDLLHRIADLTQDIAIAFKAVYLYCDGVIIRQHNEPAGLQETWHYHTHVIPCEPRGTVSGDFSKDNTHWPSPDEKRPYADKLRVVLQK